VCWIELAHNVQCWAFVNTGMNICLVRARNCLTRFQLLNEGLVLGDNSELFKVNFVETKGWRCWGLEDCIVMHILKVLWPIRFATGLLEDGNVARLLAGHGTLAANVTWLICVTVALRNVHMCTLCVCVCVCSCSTGRWLNRVGDMN
jgi:hypothetical protein